MNYFQISLWYRKRTMIKQKNQEILKPRKIQTTQPWPKIIAKKFCNGLLNSLVKMNLNKAKQGSSHKKL